MKIILIGVLFFVMVIGGATYYIYNKPHRDPSSEISIKISSEELFNSYEANEAEANRLYLDKVVEVSGKIVEITFNQDQIPIIVLETADNFFGVRCTMKNLPLHSVVGETITVTGICTGYLSDVIITNAIVNKKLNQ
ncbi:MAG: hypothetical protein U5K54_21195 [Cytophagales bacterium]|nr:hypothetical protein [Cytophagales bacterium]